MLVVLMLSPGALAKYSGGTGTAEDPYRIATKEDLLALAADTNDYTAHFVLTADIDLSGHTFTTALIASGRESSWYDFEGTPFTGVFDGNGHIISNLTIDTKGAGNDYLGLFGKISETSQVKNLGIEDVSIIGGSGSTYLGGLAGVNGDYDRGGGTITNCYSTGQFSGDDDIGGLVGRNLGTMSNCYSTSQVQGGHKSYRLGGLVGANRDGDITNSYSAGAVTGGGNSRGLGGLVGINEGTMSNCYSTSQVQGEWSSFELGGLVGWNFQGTITNCYATGSVSGGNYSGNVGGLVGGSYDAAIINCYATGQVSGAYRVGGLVANNSSMVIYSYWDVETSGLAESAAGEGKTTEQLHNIDTFSNWAAEPAVWTIDEGSDYPHLAYEQRPGEPINRPLLSQLLDGQGTERQPYLISDAAELELMGALPNQRGMFFAELISDVDLSGYSSAQAVIPLFSGVFDGAGFTISNLTIDTKGAGSRYLGLFGQIGETGQVKNLGIEDVNVIGGIDSSNLGGLAGENLGTITDCSAKGSITSGDESYALGGLVGCNGGTISKCYCSSDVTGHGGDDEGSDGLGGLVGINDGSITNCHATGSVTAGIDSQELGGLVGANNGHIAGCYSTSSVTGADYSDELGGLVGQNGGGGNITNCYAIGSVTGSDHSVLLGGLVGTNLEESYITNCYAIGFVHGGHEAGPVGGLVGSNDEKVTASYWDVETSGQTASDGGTGKTAAEMKQRSTFTDWDFIEVWDIAENQTYPFLRFTPAGDLNHDKRVDFEDFAIMAFHWLKDNNP